MWNACCGSTAKRLRKVSPTGWTKRKSTNNKGVNRSLCSAILAPVGHQSRETTRGSDARPSRHRGGYGHGCHKWKLTFYRKLVYNDKVAEDILRNVEDF